MTVHSSPPQKMSHVTMQQTQQVLKQGGGAVKSVGGAWAINQTIQVQQ